MFNINFCGYNANLPDYSKIYRPNGTNDYLFLLILSPMHFYLDNYELLAKPGACILYEPQYPQHYIALKEFSNSYVHFTNDNKNYFDNYNFPINKLFYPTSTYEINSLLQKINTEYLISPKNYLLQIDAYITQLHIHLDRHYLPEEVQSYTSSDLFSQFQSLRLQMLSHCEYDWNIEKMCKIINLEKSQLYNYYKIFFQTTPKAELINARIQKAKYLLTNEAIKINQIAKECGFYNIHHFTRYFKKICKCTPSEFSNNKNTL